MELVGHGHILCIINEAMFDKLNVPDSIGHDSQEKTDGSPLVQGSVNRSQDKDSRERDEKAYLMDTQGVKCVIT